MFDSVPSSWLDRSFARKYICDVTHGWDKGA
jgi:hypothetical protein